MSELEELEELEELKEANKVMMICLADISNMCVGEFVMGRTLDANQIGEMIYEVTGLNNPDLNDRAKSLNTGTLL